MKVTVGKCWARCSHVKVVAVAAIEDALDAEIGFGVS